MRLIFGVVLLIGLALAGGAVFLAQTYIGSYEQALEDERQKKATNIPLVEVYVAGRDMGFGDVLSTEDAILVQWPRDNLPEGFFSENNPIYTEGDASRVTLRPLLRNEILLASNVSAPGADAGLTSRLKKGQRAMTIEVDVSSGVSGFLRPGDHVDVYWTGRPPAGLDTRSGDVTRLIESSIQLIAVDQTAMDSANNGPATIARTVTVAATPQQVAALTQAQSTGRLTLSLMGANEEVVKEAIEVDQHSLLGMSNEPAPVVQAQEQVCTIRTRRGAEVVEIPIPCTN